MGALRNMPVTGVLVIATIAVLFILAVILLFYVRIRYRFLEGKARGSDPEVRGFRSAVLKEYTAAYKQYGQDVNTPAFRVLRTRFRAESFSSGDTASSRSKINASAPR